jgi:F-type H+-transporting ATPase subunit b
MIFAADAGVDLPLWSGIAWAIFAAILVYFAGGPLVKALRKREESTVVLLAKAETAQKELATVRAKIDADLARVRAEAAEMLAEGKRDAAALRIDLVNQAKQEIDRIQSRTTREISQAEHTAKIEMFRLVANRAVSAAEGALKKELKPDDHAKLLDRSFASLERTLAGGRK